MPLIPRDISLIEYASILLRIVRYCVYAYYVYKLFYLGFDGFYVFVLYFYVCVRGYGLFWSKTNGVAAEAAVVVVR